ncbi:MAG: DNA-binding transcriptional activator of the family, partial [Paenibacillus sp.]|nr:DNA-binding transcriptional activator of the family [Paenibacillus sp.]
ARAIFMMGLPPRFGVRLAQMESMLEVQKNTSHGHVMDTVVGGRWRANLFGVFNFILEGQELQKIHWKRKKTKELALYLLLQQGYSATREQIAEALYPDQEPDKMANQLYVAAHQLKSVISDYFGVDGGVVIKDGIVRLKDGLIGEVDVEQYQALVRVGDQLWLQDRGLADRMYEKAALLYDDIVVDVQYVDWLERFRERLLKKQCELLQRLGRYAVDNGQYDRAEAFYRQWINLTPLTEEAYQELLRVYQSQGKRSEAEFLYKQLELQLQKEIGVVPLSETRDIIRR